MTYTMSTKKMVSSIPTMGSAIIEVNNRARNLLNKWLSKLNIDFNKFMKNIETVINEEIIRMYSNGFGSLKVYTKSGEVFQISMTSYILEDNIIVVEKHPKMYYLNMNSPNIIEEVTEFVEAFTISTYVGKMSSDNVPTENMRIVFNQDENFDVAFNGFSYENHDKFKNEIENFSKCTDIFQRIEWVIHTLGRIPNVINATISSNYDDSKECVVILNGNMFSYEIQKESDSLEIYYIDSNGNWSYTTDAFSIAYDNSNVVKLKRTKEISITDPKEEMSGIKLYIPLMINKFQEVQSELKELKKFYRVE